MYIYGSIVTRDVNKENSNLRKTIQNKTLHRLATQAARASTSLFSCSCSYFTIISILHNFTSIFGCNFTSLGVILHLWGVILHFFAAFQAFRAFRAF